MDLTKTELNQPRLHLKAKVFKFVLNKELQSDFKFRLLICQERSNVSLLGRRKRCVWVPPKAGVVTWSRLKNPVGGEAHSGQWPMSWWGSSGRAVLAIGIYSKLYFH